MIPIRDTNRSERYPVINNSIIALTVLAFIIELLQGSRLKEFIYLYGLVPASYTEPHVAARFTTNRQMLLLIAAGSMGQPGGIA